LTEPRIEIVGDDVLITGEIGEEGDVHRNHS
jgi:hypothetical protein